jgi:hypothetical protein
MGSYGAELLTLLCQQGETAILMLDQSKLVEGFECLMLSIRVGERALPWLWQVVETGGSIGFDVQEALLNEALNHLPKSLDVVLMGDRFYGTSALIIVFSIIYCTMSILCRYDDFVQSCRSIYTPFTKSSKLLV